jgi:exodeoxyribonuclease-3
MRIATWNINSVRARIDLVERWLKEQAPDALLLQETKAKDSEFPTETFLPLGYHTARTGQSSYNGVAIISRFPIKDVQTEFAGSDGPAEDRRLIFGTIEPEGGPPLRLCSVYVPNGKSLDSPAFPEKLAFLRRLSETLREENLVGSSPSMPLIVGGDFNIARDERDVFDAAAMTGKLHFSEEEHRAFDHLLSLELVDLFRETSADSGAFSWWDYRMQAFRRNRGLRIDYLLGNRAPSMRLVQSFIDRGPRSWLKPSDHTPVVADLQLSP